MENADVEFRFVDSYRFMSESLDNLASYLKFDDFKILRSTLSHLNDEQLKLLTKKGVYPMNIWIVGKNLMKPIYRKSKVKLELLTDVDMMLFVEKGIRGGITQCCTKYSKANNKYLNGKN
ncbi:hypothetical protein PPYR_01650 [Photinus pyralis]|uniref:Uncharacterized protein n=1 Tax=Photinus pyralis TaxID=7054 RepID=A0A5N4B5P5_PHOPY|nr:hypothetical protein PPYR_01650 [Photinus pyralis]